MKKDKNATFWTKYQTFDQFSPKYQKKYQTDQSTKWLSKVPNFWDLVPKIPNLTSLSRFYFFEEELGNDVTKIPETFCTDFKDDSAKSNIYYVSNI